LQCITQKPSKPVPASNYTGPGFTRAISEACVKLLPGGSKFLATGNPYVSLASKGGKDISF